MRKRGDNGLTYISNRGIYELTKFKKDVYDSADITVHHAVDSQHEWSASYTRSGTLVQCGHGHQCRPDPHRAQ